MLVLTRRTGERLFMIDPNGKEIEVAILGVKGNQVRIGIEADKDTQVHREEIWRRIQQETKKAS